MKHNTANPKYECIKCGTDKDLCRCEASYICKSCTAASRVGRDETTQVIKQNTAESESPDALTLNEAKMDVVGLLPEVVISEAANHRAQLLTFLGTDCAAMAMTAELEIQPKNSLEKMLVHQMAVCHKTTMELMAKAYFQDDAITQNRMLQTAAKMMSTFQNGLLTIKNLRSDGHQNIVVKHVSVSEGGQAVIGNIQGGSQK